VLRKRRAQRPSEAQGPWGSAPALPRPGWYPDPSGGDAERYWDGRQWTASARPQQWRTGWAHHRGDNPATRSADAVL